MTFVMNCAQCGKQFDKPKFANSLCRFCSKECDKRFWYAHNNTAKQSIYNTDDSSKLTSTSGKAFYWEKVVCERINAVHTRKQKIDIEWNGYKIDVKISNLYKRKMQRGKPTKVRFGYWVFNRNLPKDIDYFLCLCLINNKLVKSYLIPSSIFGKIGTTIGIKSKFDKYLFNL